MYVLYSQNEEIVHNWVLNWVARVRANNYQQTDVATDYSKSSQNAIKFNNTEQKQIRRHVLEDELKCSEVTTWYSSKEDAPVEVSKSTIRRILKRKFEDEPSMVAAAPKGMRIGGNTAHHNRCRLAEAKYWNSKD